jgi:two-component system osmolarity sensor histidine kinase EnvZ
MLAGVSHDLRTPLTRLRLSLELMSSDAELTEEEVDGMPDDLREIYEMDLEFGKPSKDLPLISEMDGW